MIVSIFITALGLWALSHIVLKSVASHLGAETIKKIKKVLVIAICIITALILLYLGFALGVAAASATTQ